MCTSLQNLRNRFRDRLCREDGFTLIELTVVVTLLGVIMPIIVGLLYTSVNTQNAVVSQASGQVAESTLRDVLRNDVESATWMTYGYDFADLSNALAMQTHNGQCVAWRIADSGNVQRTVYTRASGPTNIGFNANGVTIIKASNELNEHQFTVTPSGTLEYSINLTAGTTNREVSGTLRSKVIQNEGQAEGTCFIP